MIRWWRSDDEKHNLRDGLQSEMYMAIWDGFCNPRCSRQSWVWRWVLDRLYIAAIDHPQVLRSHLSFEQNNNCAHNQEEKRPRPVAIHTVFCGKIKHCCWGRKNPQYGKCSQKLKDMKFWMSCPDNCIRSDIEKRMNFELLPLYWLHYLCRLTALCCWLFNFDKWIPLWICSMMMFLMMLVADSLPQDQSTISIRYFFSRIQSFLNFPCIPLSSCRD